MNIINIVIDMTDTNQDLDATVLKQQYYENDATKQKGHVTN